MTSNYHAYCIGNRKVRPGHFCNSNERWAVDLIINAGSLRVGEALKSERYISEKFKFHLLNRIERKLWSPLVTLRAMLGAVIKLFLPFVVRQDRLHQAVAGHVIGRLIVSFTKKSKYYSEIIV